MGIHWQELIVILLIVLVIFGPKRLPEIGSSLGRGLRGFRDSLNGLGERPDAAGSIVETTAARHEAGANHGAPVAVPVPVEVVDTDAPRPSAG